MLNSIFSSKYPFKNPPLPYGYSSLEPFIDSKTMHLHHDKHLETYVDNLNKVLANHEELWNYSLQELIMNSDILPYKIRTPVLNNAGGVYNHVFYFQSMTDNKNERPSELVSFLISKSFGSYDGFKRAMKDAALGVFGSGYAWLVVDFEFDKLVVMQTANQDTLLNLRGIMPLLNLDVWEHAYYLKNYNKRNEYIDNWFNVVNWKFAELRLRSVRRA